MVTKAVSDQFGKGGIADQMIKFNGYPLLENDDHAFGVSGESVFIPSVELKLTAWTRTQSLPLCGKISFSYLRKE